MFFYSVRMDEAREAYVARLRVGVHPFKEITDMCKPSSLTESEQKACIGF